MSSKKLTNPLTAIIFGCFIALLYNLGPVSAQKRQLLTEEEQVQEAVSKEVAELIASKDFVKTKNKKYADVKGFIVVDIAVVKNGQISSFFKVDSDIKNIKFIEFLADEVMEHKFYFKLPKQQRYKIRQTITIE